MTSDSTQKKRTLGFWMLTALVTGNMIGSGIFMLPSSLAAFGSISLLAWGVTAFGAICLAFVFSDLSRIIPGAGGPYKYTLEAFGPFAGFQMAYCYWIAGWVGNAAIVVAFVSYLSALFPMLANPIDGLMAALIILWTFTFINTLGLREAGIVQIIATVLKLIPLILIGSLGLHYIHPANLAAPYYNVTTQTNFSALSSAAMLTMWSFIGLESATIPADAVHNPKRNIPLATIIGTLIATTVYILSTTAIMGIIPNAVLQKSSAPFADAASILFGHWGGLLVALGAVISCAGVLNGWILLQGQVPLAAANDGLFPKIFKKTNVAGAPIVGLMLSSILISILLMMSYNQSFAKQFTLIISLATLSSLIPYLFVTMARLMLFTQGKSDITKGQVIRSIIVTLLAFIYIFWAIAGSGEDILYYGSLLLFSSVPAYVVVQWMLRRG